MAVVAGWWSWRQRIRHRHFKHWWYMRLSTDSALECTRCHAVKLDDRPSHPTIPRADELDIIKENQRMALVQRVWKALAAGVSAGIAAYAIAEQAGNVGSGQLAAVILGAVGVALTTYLAPANQTA